MKARHIPQNHLQGQKEHWKFKACAVTYKTVLVILGFIPASQAVEHILRNLVGISNHKIRHYSYTRWVWYNSLSLS